MCRKAHVNVNFFHNWQLMNMQMCVTISQMHRKMHVCADLKKMLALINWCYHMGYLLKHPKTHVNVNHTLMFRQTTLRYVFDKSKTITNKTHIRIYKTTDTFKLKTKTYLYHTRSCLIRRICFTKIVLLRNKNTYMLLLSRYLFDIYKTITKTKNIYEDI